MATGKITLTALAGLHGWIWDDRVIGLGARKQTRGIFYYLRYRHNGAQIMKSIGRHGSPWTPDTARVEARRLLGIVASGADPFAQPPSAEIFGAEIKRYLERKKTSLKPRAFAEVERYLTNHCAQFHRLNLADIDRRKIATLLAEIEIERGPIARNRARATLSALFTWAVQEGLAEINPVAGTAKANEGNSRDRVLTVEELRQLWRSLGDDRVSNVVRLLLLTGQRRNEIGKLTWDEIDLARNVIVLPPARTKNGQEHCVPLSRQALTIIERQIRRSGFVFGERGYGNWTDGKARLDRHLGIAAWTLHDLRRTAATGMAELGVMPHIIEAVLNHVSGHKAGVAGIYNRARYEGEMRDALQRWADHIDQITK